jgi:hypothetical protein
MVEHLPSKCKVLSSNPSTDKEGGGGGDDGGDGGNGGVGKLLKGQ